MVDYHNTVKNIEAALFESHEASFITIDTFYNMILERFPELYSLELSEDYDTKLLMRYAMKDHKGYVRVFYGLKRILFEKESDKLLFLLQYGK